jgi:hypothetical protein
MILIMTGLCLHINHSWSKFCNMQNEKWADLCKKQSDEAFKRHMDLIEEWRKTITAKHE